MRCVDGVDKWLVRTVRFDDPRLDQAYDYFVTGELVQAIGRARAVSRECMVYLFTNEPIELPGTTIKRCRMSDALPGADTSDGYKNFEAAALELLDAGGEITNPKVTRASGVPERTGRRYWKEFLAHHKRSAQ